jgi:hypothetical protein
MLKRVLAQLFLAFPFRDEFFECPARFCAQRNTGKLGIRG